MSSESPMIGTYLWQNGKKINLEKEPDCITVYIYDPRKLELIQKLDGVLDIKNVFNEVYRLMVDNTRLEQIMASLRSQAFDLVCHHAYKPVGTNQTRYYITDKITVKFKEGVDVGVINDYMEEYHLRYVKSYNDRTFLLQITTSTGTNPVKVANYLHEKNETAYCEPNLISRFSAAYIPTDEQFQQQWHLLSKAGPELVADADISVTQAWDITKGNRNIVVAVLDDGFDMSHPDFQGVGKIVYPKDFVEGDMLPNPGPSDFHGTPCAGVAIAEDNGEGVVGAAPGCAFMPVRIPFGADANLLYEIFDYVGKYADVISCSWGPPPVYAPLHQLVYDKLTQLAATGGPRGKGCVILFAAHNFNAPLKDLKNVSGVKYLAGNRIYEHRDPIWNGNATHPDVITVSASTSLNEKAAYSNWGKEVTVCAPSNNYHPLDFSKKLKGRGITTTDNFRLGAYFSPNSRYTNLFGGTSSATPLVAGVAGLILSANPNLTAKEVKQILSETADKIEDNTPDILLNQSKGNYDGSGHSEWFGHGKINAFKAVQQAAALLPVDENNEDADTTPIEEIPLVDEPAVLEDGVLMLKLRTLVKGKMEGNNDSKIYKIKVGKKLTIQMKSKSEETDFDLYLKKGTIPSKNDYDKRSITETSNEKLELENLEAGEYFLLVNSFRGEGEYDLEVNLE
ncbi:MAG: S8 family serine peptidase [Chitinophagales bacterium]